MEQRFLPIYGDPAHTGFLRKSFDRITGVKKIYFGATITKYSLFMKPLGQEDSDRTYEIKFR